jgi:hypothetical protein
MIFSYMLDQSFQNLTLNKSKRSSNLEKKISTSYSIGERERERVEGWRNIHVPLNHKSF